ncbi:tyrosine-type recombinase/integrase [Orrella marina]|nr:site-specific integrase [Orrella marina]
MKRVNFMGQNMGQKSTRDEMAQITKVELDRLKPTDDGKTLRGDGGLVGKVRAGVRGITVQFRYEFWLDGKKHDYRLGSWPKKTLATIRAERDAVKPGIKLGINPLQAKKAERIKTQRAIAETIREAEQEQINSSTVSDLFDAWIIDGVARKDGNAELKRLFAKDVLPIIGKKAVRELSEGDIRAMLRKQMKRGVTRLMVTTFKEVNQMLNWAEKRQPWRQLLIDGNPCALVDVGKLLPADYEEERDRVLSPSEIRELNQIFLRMEEDWRNAPDRRSTCRPITKTTQVALWLCLSTLCRIGELLMTRWEHVNLDEGTWFIPRQNVKGHRGKKQEQTVYLSDFAKRQFLTLHELTGHSEWCFPAKNKRGAASTHVCLKTISKQVGDRQIQFKNRSKPPLGRAFDNSLVLSSGANGEWTPHDLRRTGATTMQELGVSLDVIDRCQNHVLAGSRVRRHYLHHDYKIEKTEAWARLGKRLEALLA